MNLSYNKDTCTPMFIAALFTIAKLWKYPRCPTTDEQIKKMWYLCTMEFYSAIKMNKILSFIGKWMELQNILSGVRFRKQKFACFLSYVENSPNTNTTIIIYTYKYIQNVFPKVGLLGETRGRGKE
jgi:hypothetical protein